jgi:GDPmannose 4,6-dehydratase
MRDHVRKRALVTGGAGQDGWYLIELLLSRGYEVFAHSRRPVDPGLHAGRVSWHTGDLTDETFLKSLLSVSKPDEIYNLAAVSRPALSWNIPIETALLNGLVPQRICEFIRRELPATRLFQASSSEIYGDSQAQLQDEETRANPRSPYGISKAYAHQIIGAYRQQYGLHLSCGILFNHESPRRPLNFVSQKIAHAAAAASLGLTETRELDERGRPILSDGKLYLGDINVRRDLALPGISSKRCVSSCKATRRRILSSEPDMRTPSRNSAKQPSRSAVSTGPNSSWLIHRCCGRSTATSRGRIPRNFSPSSVGTRKSIFLRWSV